jgi:hypothetical protein
LFAAELRKCQQIASEKNEEWQIKLLKFDSAAGSLGRDALAVVVQLTLRRQFFLISVPIVTQSTIYKS